MKYFFLLIPMAFMSACQPNGGDNSIPVVGLNQKGESKVQFVDPHFLGQKLTPLLTNISDKVSSTLDVYETMESQPWELSRVTVGLKLETEFEVIEDVLELENEGDIELRFQKR
jgi:hypothetical protein